MYIYVHVHIYIYIYVSRQTNKPDMQVQTDIQTHFWMEIGKNI